MLDRLDDADFNGDLLAEIEDAEKKFMPPKLQSHSSFNGSALTVSKRVSNHAIKRKVPVATLEELDEMSLDTAEEEDVDDDEDGDFSPEIEADEDKQNTRKRPRNRRLMVDDDSEDDEDDGSINPKIPDLRRMRVGNVGASAANSEGTPLMSTMNMEAAPPLKSETSTASSGSTPLMQKMRLSAMPRPGSQQTPPKPLFMTTGDSKKERAAKFAKKNGERYAWLEDIRDQQGVRPNEPGYDKRTLLIPQSAWNSFSPFERQYWEIKCMHWDTVVFFKKGKFYELYENDATIGNQDFDLRLTDRVNMRMAGVPESSFDHWVAQFLAKGYKVARVDQMESKLAKDMRERGSTKKSDKIVIRQLTGVLTAGTLVDPSLLTQDLSIYCMAVVETTAAAASDTEDNSVSTSFGVAFVDTSTAQFHLCTILDDDADRSKLETLLVQLNPREVVFVRGGAGPGQRNATVVPGGLASANLTKGSTADDENLLSPDAWDGMAGISRPTWRTLKNTCNSTTDWISMTARKEFWDLPTTKNELERAGYFESTSAWPEVLQSAAKDSPQALVALGGLLSYLRTLKLDKDLASLGNFSLYSPMQHSTALVLDGPTVSNLDIFTVSSEQATNSLAAAGQGNNKGSAEGTLFSLLNHACTPFGRRLLSRWTCHPLRHSAAINARLDVVEYLMANGEIGDSVKTTLRTIPDLERGLSRIHSGRCKVADFIALINGFKSVTEMVDQLRQRVGEQGGPARVQTLLRSFPPLDDILTEFSQAYDAKLAATEGRLLPFPGSDQPYDDILAQISELESWFDQHLKENRKQFGCASIVYKNMGKEPFQLEMPITVKVPDSYFRLSATKAVNRYWSPELRTKVKEHAEAMESKSMVLDSYQTRLYSRFDRHYGVLMRAVSITSELDCLLALTVASSSLGSPASRPTILDSNGGSGGYLEFRQLRHPCVALSKNATDFVSNDVVLGRRHGSSTTTTEEDDPASMILLTGPNMGGKSTLLRQLCLGVILAQMGCYVPAQSAVILPVDRLFTRIGARDNLLAGRSTFMVEMAETSTILRYAAPRSLAVLDELGRGTSTHDGEAVAYSVLHSLCSRLGCLGFFSTHYGLLAESLLHPAAAKNGDMDVEPHLRPMYMACNVNEQEHRVTFLYRLQKGVASKSHGMNVAAMAGVPISVVERANEIAEKFERGVKQNQLDQTASKEMDNNGEENLVFPLTLQSDFANLLRMAELESNKSKISGNGDGNNDNEEEVPVGGADGATKANENQYWSCIVDHLQRTMTHL